MLKNYFKVALRNLWKNRGYSAINIFGLAIGITCAALIFLWVQNEVSFDHFIPERERVYVVPTHQSYEGEWVTFNATPGPLAEALKNEIPEIEKAGRTMPSNLLFNVGDKVINSSGRYADSDIPAIFGLTFIEGDPQTALDRINSVVLTRETALKLFGTDKDILHREIRVNDNENFEVTGVIDNLPDNVSFGFNWLIPMKQFTRDNAWTKDYGNNFAETFVKLIPDANFDAVDAKVRKILPAKSDNKDIIAFLFSSEKWHLYSEFKNAKAVGGPIEYVRLFTIIAVIVLLIACINFMNLSTARSEKRANEVGVRKALGSGKKTLIIQFITEALLTALSATVISILFLLFLLPYFNALIEKQLAIDLTNPLHIGFLIGVTLVCGILAGLYPAFYLSSFKPVEVLKGKGSNQGGATFIRKGLVIAQFVVSIVFIISTIVVYQQVQHVKHRDLGLNKENVIEFPARGDVIRNFDPIRQEMLATGLVKSVSLNSSEVFSDNYNGSGLSWEGGGNTENILIRFRNVSYDYFETLGMEIVEGRGFSENPANDSTSVLITQSFEKLMGPGSAVGKTIRRGETFTVIGVVKDYLYGDMYGASQPVMFFNHPGEASFLYAKTRAGIDSGTLLSSLEEIFKKYNPAYPFEYTFVDDSFNARFKNEALIGNLSQIFAILAILISCLGLFGLSAYTAEQRRKEIGVRKVLGSSVPGIVRLLSADFIRLVFLAIVIAIPIAWYTMHEWLAGFAYHVEIHWWVFFTAGVAAVLIALITVSFQAIKAAVANPVKSLRTE